MIKTVAFGISTIIRQSYVRHRLSALKSVVFIAPRFSVFTFQCVFAFGELHFEKIINENSKVHGSEQYNLLVYLTFTQKIVSLIEFFIDRLSNYTHDKIVLDRGNKHIRYQLRCRKPKCNRNFKSFQFKTWSQTNVSLFCEVLQNYTYSKIRELRCQNRLPQLNWSWSIANSIANESSWQCIEMTRLKCAQMLLLSKRYQAISQKKINQKFNETATRKKSTFQIQPFEWLLGCYQWE